MSIHTISVQKEILSMILLYYFWWFLTVHLLATFHCITSPVWALQLLSNFSGHFLGTFRVTIYIWSTRMIRNILNFKKRQCWINQGVCTRENEVFVTPILRAIYMTLCNIINIPWIIYLRHITTYARHFTYACKSNENITLRNDVRNVEFSLKEENINKRICRYVLVISYLSTKKKSVLIFILFCVKCFWNHHVIDDEIC